MGGKFRENGFELEIRGNYKLLENSN